MEIPSDKELFEATETDEAPETVADTPAEQPAAQEEGQPRDDAGRFAARQEPEPQPDPAQAPQAQQPARDEAHVPSWRLREVREEADRRVASAVAEAEQRFQRQYEMLQRQNQPRPEPQPAPDVFENPNAFLEHGVRQQVDPIKSEVQQTREFFSRMMAEEKHGPEKVQAAFDWIKQGLAQRDPEAVSTYQRAMQSMHPFGDLVTAHQQRAVYQQIGSDPNAWFEKELERRMADPAFAGAQLQKIQQSTRGGQQPQGQAAPLVQLPPSLRNAPSARASNDDSEGGDISNDALWAHANR